MINGLPRGLRRRDAAVLVVAGVLLALSAFPWWHDTLTSPSSYTPWHASTVWSGCVLAGAAAAVLWVVVAQRRARWVAAALALVSALWALGYTIDLFVADPPLRGWWAFSGSDTSHGVTSVICGDCHAAFVRDQLAVVSGESGLTIVAWVALALIVLLGVTMIVRVAHDDGAIPA